MNEHTGMRPKTLEEAYELAKNFVQIPTKLTEPKPPPGGPASRGVQEGRGGIRTEDETVPHRILVRRKL
ncbi:MAG: hypothetical protein KatS3mg112_0171 [Thermogutta sp.]|nr:MAG: hypothetical protein KatS3mg112_0171 [Thermogutta sp.]